MIRESLFYWVVGGLVAVVLSLLGLVWGQLSGQLTAQSADIRAIQGDLVELKLDLRGLLSRFEGWSEAGKESGHHKR